jgi:hypothetical protein
MWALLRRRTRHASVRQPEHPTINVHPRYLPVQMKYQQHSSNNQRPPTNKGLLIKQKYLECSLT